MPRSRNSGRFQSAELNLLALSRDSLVRSREKQRAKSGTIQAKPKDIPMISEFDFGKPEIIKPKYNVKPAMVYEKPIIPKQPKQRKVQKMTTEPVQQAKPAPVAKPVAVAKKDIAAERTAANKAWGESEKSLRESIRDLAKAEDVENANAIVSYETRIKALETANDDKAKQITSLRKVVDTISGKNLPKLEKVISWADKISRQFAAIPTFDMEEKEEKTK